MAFSPTLYRHDDAVLPRPYAFDVDPEDWLWEGTTRNRLLGHNLRTAELRVITLPEFEGHVVFQAFAWEAKLLMVLGEALSWRHFAAFGCIMAAVGFLFVGK